MVKDKKEERGRGNQASGRALHVPQAVLQVRGCSPQTDVAAMEMTQLDDMKEHSGNNLNWVND